MGVEADAERGRIPPEVVDEDDDEPAPRSRCRSPPGDVEAARESALRSIAERRRGERVGGLSGVLDASCSHSCCCGDGGGVCCCCCCCEVSDRVSSLSVVNVESRLLIVARRNDHSPGERPDAAGENESDETGETGSGEAGSLGLAGSGVRCRAKVTSPPSTSWFHSTAAVSPPPSWMPLSAVTRSPRKKEPLRAAALPGLMPVMTLSSSKRRPTLPLFTSVAMKLDSDDGGSAGRMAVGLVFGSKVTEAPRCRGAAPTASPAAFHAAVAEETAGVPESLAVTTFLRASVSEPSDTKSRDTWSRRGELAFMSISLTAESDRSVWRSMAAIHASSHGSTPRRGTSPIAAAGTESSQRQSPRIRKVYHRELDS